MILTKKPAGNKILANRTIPLELNQEFWLNWLRNIASWFLHIPLWNSIAPRIIFSNMVEPIIPSWVQTEDDYELLAEAQGSGAFSFIWETKGRTEKFLTGKRRELMDPTTAATAAPNPAQTQALSLFRTALVDLMEIHPIRSQKIVFPVVDPSDLYDVVFGSNFSAEDLPPLSTFPSLTDHKLNTSISMSIEKSGLSICPITFHIRAECHRLWSFLDDNVDEVKFVQGPPGVGKSIEVYMYAMHNSIKLNRTLLYIHSDIKNYHIIYRHEIQAGTISYKRIRKDVNTDNSMYKHLANWLRPILNSETIDLLVVDGLFPNAFFTSMCNSKIWKQCQSLIICSSFQAVKIKQDDELSFNTFEMCSWTYGEYKKAIKSKALIKGDDFKERYYYAGGSIRLMKWNIGKVKRTLDRHLSKVQDFSTLLSGHVGYSAESFVNSLMAVFRKCSESVSTFLSEYVTKQLTSKCTVDAINRCRLILPENFSWQGWVSELEVLTMLEISKKLVVLNENNVREEWVCDGDKNIIRFWDISDIDVNSVQSGQYLFPNKWNQATFDALCVIKSNRKRILRVLQITNAQTHSCKLEYLTPFVELLKITTIEYIVICRQKNFSKFSKPVAANCSGYSELIAQKGFQAITVRKVYYEESTLNGWQTSDFHIDSSDSSRESGTSRKRKRKS
eukprot:gene9507-19756_t